MNERLESFLYWVGIVVVLLATFFTIYYGVSAITSHFFPDERIISTATNTIISESHTTTCFKNGVVINCSDMGVGR